MRNRSNNVARRRIESGETRRAKRGETRRTTADCSQLTTEIENSAEQSAKRRHRCHCCCRRSVASVATATAGCSQRASEPKAQAQSQHNVPTNSSRRHAACGKAAVAEGSRQWRRRRQAGKKQKRKKRQPASQQQRQQTAEQSAAQSKAAPEPASSKATPQAFASDGDMRTYTHTNTLTHWRAGTKATVCDWLQCTLYPPDQNDFLYVCVDISILCCILCRGSLRIVFDELLWFTITT